MILKKNWEKAEKNWKGKERQGSRRDGLLQTPTRPYHSDNHEVLSVDSQPQQKRRKVKNVGMMSQPGVEIEGKRVKS